NDKKTTDAEREKIYSALPKADKAVSALLQIAEKAPKDDPGAVEALQWSLNYSGRDAEGQKTQDKVLDLLIKDYPANDKIGTLVTSLAYSTNPKAEQLLQAVIEKNSKKENQGKATYALAMLKKNHLQAASQADKSKLETELEKLFET